MDRSLPETRKYQGGKQSGKRGYVEPEPEPEPEPELEPPPEPEAEAEP